MSVKTYAVYSWKGMAARSLIFLIPFSFKQLSDRASQNRPGEQARTSLETRSKGTEILTCYTARLCAKVKQATAFDLCTLLPFLLCSHSDSPCAAKSRTESLSRQRYFLLLLAPGHSDGDLCVPSLTSPVQSQ